MSGRSVAAGGHIDRSIVITGDGNHASIHLGEGLTLPLARPQRLSKRHRKATAENLLPLLRADTLAFEVVGREPQLAELRAWLDSDADVSVQTLIGRAGTGKTRLAIELCSRVDGADKPGETGWSAGFLRPADVANVVDQLATRQLARGEPTLLVIDYASAIHRELGQWFDRLAASDFDGKLRFLLLDREAPENFGWWHELAHPALSGHRANLFVDPDRPKRLSDLSDLESRRALFGAALQATSRVLVDRASVRDVPPHGVDPYFDRALADGRFGNPLNLAMAGLIAPERGIREALGLRRLEAARDIARREVKRMVLLGESCGCRQGVIYHALGFNGLAGGLAVATLVSDLSEELRSMDLDAPIDELSGLLERELPQEGRGADDGAEPRLGTIQPDLVGEAVIIETLLVGPKSRLATAAATFQRAYALGGRRSAEALMRLLQDYGYAAEDPAAALAERAAGEDLLQLLAVVADSIPDRDFRRLESLVAAFPENTVVLREAAATQTRRLSEIWKSVSSRVDPANPDLFNFAQRRSAAWLTNLANRLSDLGQSEEAMESAEEASAIYRRLAEAEPDVFMPLLASSLNNLGARFADMSRYKEALQASQESVTIRRGLAAADRYEPDLALSLNNLANTLRALGRTGEALTAAQEAADIRRRLAAADPDAFQPDLALSLGNLANLLGDLERLEEALKVAQEGLDIRRRLAAASPDAFTPSLALSLNNFVALLSALGQPEEALVAAQESVSIRRGLAATRPTAFEADLAMSLSNLASAFGNLDRIEEALEAAEEAAAYYRKLAAARPATFTTDLIQILDLMSTCLSGLARWEEALQTAQEASDICRRIASVAPAEFPAEFVSTLHNLPTALDALGRKEEAAQAAREAVDILRRLVAARPAVFTASLAQFLSVLGDRLEGIDRLPEAVRADHEAVGTLAPDFLAHPSAYAIAIKVYLQDYFRRSDAINQKVDSELVAPIMNKLYSMQQEEEQQE